MDTLPALVREWASGLASLSPDVIPCPNFKRDEWSDTHRRCTAFVASHGWDSLTLFGVSPRFGIIRGDWTGVLMPFWADLVEVTPLYLAFGRVRAFKDMPVRYRGVPVWEFGK